MMLPHRRVHRITFLLAGLYNIIWGLVAAADPQWMFRFAGMEPMNHTEIFACLGMVLGLYGVMYLEVARAPEKNFVPAAIGLVGKVLGPLGQIPLLVSGKWPLATGVLTIPNDLIWWIPFGWYLYDAWPIFRRNAGDASHS